MLVNFDVREQQWMDFLTGGSVMYYDILATSDLKLKCL